MTKGNSRVIEHVLGFHNRNLGVVMLKVGLHNGSPKVIELEVELHYGCPSSDQKVFWSSEAILNSIFSIWNNKYKHWH